MSSNREWGIYLTITGLLGRLTSYIMEKDSRKTPCACIVKVLDLKIFFSKQLPVPERKVLGLDHLSTIELASCGYRVQGARKTRKTIITASLGLT